MSKWISVDERLPDPDSKQFVIIQWDMVAVERVREQDGENCLLDDDLTEVDFANAQYVNIGIHADCITHWMPMPEPHKLESGVREPHSQTGTERGKSRTKKKTVDPVEGG